MFSPSTLRTLLGYRGNDYYKDIYKTLQKLNVYDNNKIDVLGVFLPTSRNYSILEDLSIDPVQKKILFFALLNSRIILSFLKATLEVHKLSFPTDLDKIELRLDLDNKNDYSFLNSSNGIDLYKYAENLEKQVYNSINSFSSNIEFNPSDNVDLFSIDLINPRNFSIRGKKHCSKIILMLDDIHQLSTKQRKTLIDCIVEKRSSTTVWISERLEALDATQLLPNGAYVGRDYNEMNLEEYWRTTPKQFENILSNIADKRVRISDDVQIQSFDELLQETINEDDFTSNLKKSIYELQGQLLDGSNDEYTFNEWFKLANEDNNSLIEKANLLQRISILISRHKNNSQLAFEFPLSTEEFEKRDKAEIKTVADFFISRKFDIPYYFGMSKLVKLAFSNIEQFLSFASELFEEVSAKAISGEQISLNSKEQEKIIKRVVSQRWKELHKIIPFSKSVISFINHFTKLSHKETFRSTAPYLHGVNGIGIKMSEYQNITLEENWDKDPKVEKLVNVLSSSLAYNLIKIELNKKQGKSNSDQWAIIYLNRWLCVHFDLPLNYGGWRPKSIEELTSWL
jgi:hypothetical protein